MIKEWIDKTWWFTDDEGKIIFSVIIEHAQDIAPPAELVELIELYSQGYRSAYCPVCKAIIRGRGKTCSPRCRQKLRRMKKKESRTAVAWEQMPDPPSS